MSVESRGAPEDFYISPGMVLPGDSGHASKVTMTPTIGRIVHYQKYGSPGGEHKAEPSPAIITKVLDDAGKCALFVMNPTGVYFNETPYSEEPKPGHWSWPPRN